MELRHLRYFVAIAETGNLSRAAAKLFVAQPPLSLQLRQLEEELGGPLFVRHPKGMRLTPAGESLLPEARELLERADRLKRGALPAAAVAQLRIGYVPSAGSTVVPDLVQALRRRHPGVELRLQEMISDEQRDALVGGRLDAGLARHPAAHPRMRVAAFLADPFCLALPSGRARGLPDPVDLRGYAAEAFVAFTRHRGPAYFDRAIRLCGDAGFSPRIGHEGSTLYGVLDLVHAGLGVALVPSSASLLRVPGVAFRALLHQRRDEGLALLLPKPLANAVAQDLGALVQSRFDAMAQRMTRRASRAGRPATVPPGRGAAQ